MFIIESSTSIHIPLNEYKEFFENGIKPLVENDPSFVSNNNNIIWPTSLDTLIGIEIFFKNDNNNNKNNNNTLEEKVDRNFLSKDEITILTNFIHIFYSDIFTSQKTYNLIVRKVQIIQQQQQEEEQQQKEQTYDKNQTNSTNSNIENNEENNDNNGIGNNNTTTTTTRSNEDDGEEQDKFRKQQRHLKNVIKQRRHPDDKYTSYDNESEYYDNEKSRAKTLQTLSNSRVKVVSLPASLLLKTQIKVNFYVNNDDKDDKDKMDVSKEGAAAAPERAHDGDDNDNNDVDNDEKTRKIINHFQDLLVQILNHLNSHFITQLQDYSSSISSSSSSLSTTSSLFSSIDTINAIVL